MGAHRRALFVAVRGNHSSILRVRWRVLRCLMLVAVSPRYEDFAVLGGVSTMDEGLYCANGSCYHPSMPRPQLLTPRECCVIMNDHSEALARYHCRRNLIFTATEPPTVAVTAFL
eukprot:SAG31_NODE_17903_length_654_cov_0.881081_2_plen_115_part_00